MPYADPARQREYNRILYQTRYQTDPEFRADEAVRKAIWYWKNQTEILWRYRFKRCLKHQFTKTAQAVVDAVNDMVAPLSQQQLNAKISTDLTRLWSRQRNKLLASLPENCQAERDTIEKLLFASFYAGANAGAKVRGLVTASRTELTIPASPQG